MAAPELIYCADGNARFAEIAIDAGFTYGAQVPNTVYFTPEFVDQDWRNPDLEKYEAAVAKHSPRLATVLDWERWEQLSEVLAWAETIAVYSETVIIIPKVLGGIERLPRRVGGRPVRLGYSVPTRFGGTTVPIGEFGGWPVHLLGGSPIQQRRLFKYLNVASLDGNYHNSMATRYNQFFVADGSATYARNRFWPTLKEASGGERWGDGSDTAGAPYEAFRRSCQNIWAMWHGKSQRQWRTIPARQPALL
jgi:hypothetical protein